MDALDYPRIDANFPSFSEGLSLRVELELVEAENVLGYFPSFSEGLSLRAQGEKTCTLIRFISLPFRRDFH